MADREGRLVEAGKISVNQARAIGTVLGGLTELDQTQQAQAEQLLLDMAETMDSDRLAKATPQVLAQGRGHRRLHQAAR